MTELQTNRIFRALQSLTEYERLKLNDLLEEGRKTEQFEKKLDSDSAIYDAEFEAMKSRLEAQTVRHREALQSIGADSKETNAAIAENYRRQDELFERLGALSARLIS